MIDDKTLEWQNYLVGLRENALRLAESTEGWIEEAQLDYDKAQQRLNDLLNDHASAIREAARIDEMLAALGIEVDDQ